MKTEVENLQASIEESKSLYDKKLKKKAAGKVELEEELKKSKQEFEEAHLTLEDERVKSEKAIEGMKAQCAQWIDDAKQDHTEELEEKQKILKNTEDTVKKMKAEIESLKMKEEKTEDKVRKSSSELEKSKTEIEEIKKLLEELLDQKIQSLKNRFEI